MASLFGRASLARLFGNVSLECLFGTSLLDVLVRSLWEASDKMFEEVLKEVCVKTPLVSSGDFHVNFHS